MRLFLRSGVFTTMTCWVNKACSSPAELLSLQADKTKFNTKIITPPTILDYITGIYIFYCLMAAMPSGVVLLFLPQQNTYRSLLYFSQIFYPGNCRHIRL